MFRVNCENTILKNSFFLFSAFFIGLLIGGFNKSIKPYENNFKNLVLTKIANNNNEIAVDPANIKHYLK